MNSIQKTTTAIVKELTELLSINLSLAGFDDEKAELTAGTIVDELRRHFGGANIYFTKGVYQDTAPRNAEIYECYKSGFPVPEIAMKFNLSFTAVYNVIRREREARRAENFAPIDVKK